jgi:hypothetical protein
MGKKRAVMVNAEKNQAGDICIRLDDLVSKGACEWRQDVIFTSKDFDLDTFENLAFEEKEMADFGYAIMTRLFAFYKQGEL